MDLKARQLFSSSLTALGMALPCCCVSCILQLGHRVDVEPPGLRLLPVILLEIGMI